MGKCYKTVVTELIHLYRFDCNIADPVLQRGPPPSFLQFVVAKAHIATLYIPKKLLDALLAIFGGAATAVVPTRLFLLRKEQMLGMERL